VPVVGTGTSGNFDIDDPSTAAAVVTTALDHGATVFDSSPMYGDAEGILGRSLGERRREAVILTKVWTDDDAEAERQIARSLAFYGGRIELLQIHNMVAWRTRLDELEAHRDAGEVGYIGATHWRASSFDELEAAMRTGRVDAVQVPYNPVEREVERRIFPVAAELGLGVVVMRPFADGGLFEHPPAPAALAALAGHGVATWAQALVAWGLSHPVTTVSIPATSRPARAAENAAVMALAPLPGELRNLVARLATG
jgi:aryl-alcohol dehydrogenase-like predicted oxidoreductase